MNLEKNMRKTGRGRIRRDYIPFGRPDFSSQEIAAVVRVLKGGWVGMGAQVASFEKELSKAVGAPHVVTVNSCTSALFLALKLHDVGPGDDVVVPSLTWCSTANAALYLGARPVFCDVDPNTLCVTPETVLAALTPKTKAVIVVHYGGLGIDVAAVRAALPSGVALIEDAAHAFGARYPNGKPVGSSGNIVCFSFYANKNLSTGEGGALALFDASQADRIRSLRQHGLPIDAWKRFTNPRVNFLDGTLDVLGYKMNYTDLQAAIGRVQLKRQPELVKRRLQIAKIYQRKLEHLMPRFETLIGQDSPAHARHLFVVKYPDGARKSRNQFFHDLRERNVGVSIHYAPLHKMSLYGPRTHARLPHTEAAAGRILTLPIGASMTAKDAEYVIAMMRDCL
jgi:dTDP-4-amino-4,6-dideoxygalactose transaminase